MTPQVVSDSDLAFPKNVDALLPKWNDIPKEFKNFGGPWSELAELWFFSGLAGDEFTVKTGIDKNAALRHLSTIMRSFEPKHEHKIAVVAYLMSLWFDFKESEVDEVVV